MQTGSIILLVLLVVLIIFYPIFMYKKNRTEQDKQKQMIEALKPDQYVITYSGVFGKVVEIIEKEFGKFIVIETGEKHKNFITVSENAIYMLVNNNPKVYDTQGNVVENKVENSKTETLEEIQKEQAEKPAKNQRKKK